VTGFINQPWFVGNLDQLWIESFGPKQQSGSQSIKWANSNQNNRENSLIFPPGNQNEVTHLFISQDNSVLSGSKNRRLVIGVSNHELVNNQPDLEMGDQCTFILVHGPADSFLEINVHEIYLDDIPATKPDSTFPLHGDSSWWRSKQARDAINKKMVASKQGEPSQRNFRSVMVSKDKLGQMKTMFFDFLNGNTY